jgi:hypothetical protein
VLLFIDCEPVRSEAPKPCRITRELLKLQKRGQFPDELVKTEGTRSHYGVCQLAITDIKEIVFEELSKVRTTPESVVGDVEVYHQRHRTRRICEVTSQLDVPTSLTSVSSHQLSFRFVCCEKEVNELLNCPVVILLGTRVVGTSAEVVPQGSI